MGKSCVGKGWSRLRWSVRFCEWMDDARWWEVSSPRTSDQVLWPVGAGSCCRGLQARTIEPFLLVPSSGSTIVLVPQPSSNAMFILYVTSSDIAEAYVKRIMARNTLLFRELTRQNKEVNEYYTATLTNGETIQSEGNNGNDSNMKMALCQSSQQPTSVCITVESHEPKSANIGNYQNLTFSMALQDFIEVDLVNSMQSMLLLRWCHEYAYQLEIDNDRAHPLKLTNFTLAGKYSDDAYTTRFDDAIPTTITLLFGAWLKHCNFLHFVNLKKLEWFMALNLLLVNCSSSSKSYKRKVVSASRTILAITSAPTDSEEEKKCFHSITTNMDMLVIFALRKYVQMIFIKTTIMSPRILLHLLTRMALGCYLKRDGDVQTRNQNLLQGKISRYNPISVENEDRNTMATRLIHLPRHPWCLNLLRSHQRMPALMLRNPVAVASLQRT
ncbi:hypothetical protein V6N11_034717 [Hibiscus sabdariffa]|uniref:Uncharacterized protein n=1 Tax=Hibiscus sabdariffa TaxID=183260 RepID=A0ABR2NED2_9ROSI